MDKNKYIVDRIEGNCVVLESEESNIFNVKKSDIIGDVKEGEVLYRKNNLYFIDKKYTGLRKEEINKLMKGIWEE